MTGASGPRDSAEEGGGVLLALETSGPRGSVALRLGSGEIVEEVLPERRGHGARILPAVDALLRQAGVVPGQLAGVVVGSGPGSFTGIRVAAAAGLGLARAARKPLWGVSSLASGVLPGFGGGASGTLVVVFDARGERLFTAAYRWSAQDRLTVTMAPRFARLGDIVDGTLPVPGRSGSEPVRFAGPGARRHVAALTGAGLVVAEAPLGDATARGCLALAAAAPHLLEAWEPGREPTYLRATSAERSA